MASMHHSVISIMVDAPDDAQGGQDVWADGDQFGMLLG